MEPLQLTQPALTSRPPVKGCFGTHPVLPLGKQLQVKLEYISNRQLLLPSSESETHSSTGWELAQVSGQSHALFSSGCLQQAFSWGTSRGKAINQPTLQASQGPWRKSSRRPPSEQAMGNQGFSWKGFGQGVFWVSQCHSHGEPHCQVPQLQITAGLCDQ